MKIYAVYIDSGATHHLFFRRSIFLRYTKMDGEPFQAQLELLELFQTGMFDYL